LKILGLNDTALWTNIVYYELVPGTVSEGLNGWSEALTVGLAV